MGGRRILWLWLGEELWAPVFTREEEGARDSLVVGLAYSPKNMVGYFLEKKKSSWQEVACHVHFAV